MRTALILDIETVGHDCAAEFVPPPDLAAITAAKNLKDPVKIAEDIAKRQADAVEAHKTALSRCALDWNLSRIVAMGWAGDDGPVVSRVAKNETDEQFLLTEFWGEARGRDLVGFSARTFDLPTIIQRSRLLDVPHPAISLGRYGRGDVIDLRDVLTFDDARYEAIMPRSLKVFCRRFGITVTDPIDGAEIPALVAAGRWDEVLAHVEADIALTRALARRLGVTSRELVNR